MTLIVVLLLLLIFLTFIVFISHKMTRPERSVGDWDPGDLDIEYEEVSFITEDGVNIKGWWMDKDSHKTLICLHGYTASRWYDVYMKPLLDILKDEPYNLIFIDLRAHGVSGGDRCTFSDKEYLDLEASMDWLEKNHPKGCEKIGVVGYSMGAMVAIKGLASDERIDCSVADSPPMNPDSTFSRSLKYFTGLPPFLYHFIKPVSRLLYGIKHPDMYDFSDRIDKPLLLIGGKNDPIIEVDEIRSFYEINKQKNDEVTLWITEAEHVRSIRSTPKEYKKRIVSFLKRYM
ncbi:MAG: alpha/beta fold hydrolase [Candidatus Saliniplasma sp.]